MKMPFAIKIPIFVSLIFLNFLPSSLCASQFPCYFIFGDSLVDNGNNNQLNTNAKVNYKPYGVDFPQGPTGRFTNGRNIADIIGELLGFDSYIPPFATAQGTDNIIKGVNYGSGSAGIRSETGEQLGDRISIDKQLINHNLTISHIAQLLGNESSTKHLLNKCLYLFVIGSNDYINNYYHPEYYTTSDTYTTEEYAAVLIQQYSQQLKTIYNYGARKVAVSGVGPIGCTPEEIARGTNGNLCVDYMNEAVDLFNDKLKILVNELNNNLDGAKFLYVGAMSPDPAFLFKLGLRILNKPCCKVSNIGQCIPGTTPCLLRALHAFYDNFHPTEIVNKAVGTSAYFEIRKLI
ncbi:hypothetical protein ACJIZ3_003553 [Penstemon smallii]|uniref:Uncharacterized protein n=1 Tax=Penstemon smallii TaxID=265156 RepID=A0ABD3UB29_9LAMI